MQINTGNQKYDESLAKEFQHHMKKENIKNGVFDQVKSNEEFMEIKWTERQDHVQDNADVAHQDVIMYCNTNQLPEFDFCGAHYEPHSANDNA